MRLTMKGSYKHIKVDKNLIELYDIVENDLKIEECYGRANEILLNSTVLEKTRFDKYNKIEKMRITALNPQL